MATNAPAAERHVCCLLLFHSSNGLYVGFSYSTPQTKIHQYKGTYTLTADPQEHELLVRPPLHDPQDSRVSMREPLAPRHDACSHLLAERRTQLTPTRSMHLNCMLAGTNQLTHATHKTRLLLTLIPFWVYFLLCLVAALQVGAPRATHEQQRGDRADR